MDHDFSLYCSRELPPGVGMRAGEVHVPVLLVWLLAGWLQKTKQEDILIHHCLFLLVQFSVVSTAADTAE